MRQGVAWLLAKTVAGLAATWRVEVDGLDGIRTLRARQQPRVSVLWHEHLIPLLWFNRWSRAVVLASLHVDGQRLASVSRLWGYGVTDGSSARGGVGAVRRLVRLVREGGEAAIAADGPRGPRRVAKPGPAFVAAHARAVLVPVAAGISAYTRLRSWDRMVLPAPFARVRVVFGDPLTAGAPRDRAKLVALVQESLERVNRAAAC